MEDRDGTATMNEWIPGAVLGFLGLVGAALGWLFGWRDSAARAEERNKALAKSAKDASEFARAAADHAVCEARAAIKQAISSGEDQASPRRWAGRGKGDGVHVLAPSFRRASSTRPRTIFGIKG